METNYFKEREINTINKLREIRKDLPAICNEFFVGIETTTTPLTRLGYALDLRIFFNYLVFTLEKFNKKVTAINYNDLNKIESIDIEMFIEYLSSYEIDGVHYSNSLKTKSRKLSSIKSFFKFCYFKDKIEKDPAAKVLTPKLHEKPIIRLDDDEVGKLLDIVENGDGLKDNQKKFHTKTDKRDYAMMTLFLSTGIRISELVGLDLDDIDFFKNEFKITRKGGNQTIMYFSNEVKDILLDYLDYRCLNEKLDDEPALFCSLQNKRISVREVQKIVKKYASIASPLKHITPHKLRTTYGTKLYKETRDIFVVAEVLGHKDVNTTRKHYAAISEDIKREASTKVKLDYSSDKESKKENE